MTKFNTSVKASVFASIALVSVAITGPALAAPQDADQAPQAEMSVKGADFSSTAVIKTLQSRARRVARDMCLSGTMFTATSSEMDCYNTATKSAFAQIEAKHQFALSQASDPLASADTARSAVRTAH